MNPIVRTEVLEERTYQSNIAREAIRRNTLVVLPTALGKTVIAILVASHFLYNYSNMKVLVMAPTRPLVLQHHDTFMRFLKLRPQDAQVLTGRLDPEYRLHAWRGPFRIYFATPQVVRNDHELGMSLRDFSLLVFDECHRARKNYAYTRVAQAYVNESPHPIILALTASLPKSDQRMVNALVRYENDVENILTALKYRGKEVEDFEELFPVTYGVSLETLTTVAKASDIESAINLLEEPYKTVLDPLRTGDVAMVRAMLRRGKCDVASRAKAMDQFGFNVILAFLVYSEAEKDNLVGLAWGKAQGLPPENLLKYIVLPRG